MKNKDRILCTKGGSDSIHNLKPICKNCNLSMRAMDMNEFIETYGFQKK